MSAFTTLEEQSQVAEVAQLVQQAASPSGPINPKFLRPLFPGVGTCKATHLVELAQAMTMPIPPEPRADLPLEGENSDIPAGYTYFGQFINHDITVPTSSIQGVKVAAADNRTSILDLDSVYGRGPDVDGYLYHADGPDRGIKLVVAGPISGNDVRIPHLPRGDRKPEGSPALIGDSRNDENIIVAQIHGSFLAFHNEMVDALRKRPVEGDLFKQAQEQVRWHFQWLVLWDYLPLVCGGAGDVRALVDGLETGAIKKPSFKHYTQEEAFVPLEFWAAVFRFGHAMARASYFLNDSATRPAPHPQPCHRRIPLLDFTSYADRPETDLRGRHQVPDEWGIMWPYFFPFDWQLRPWSKPMCEGVPMHPFDGPQRSMLIKPAITAALSNLPDRGPHGTSSPSLAERDLSLGDRLGMPSGQQVADAMGFDPIADIKLSEGVDAAGLPDALWNDTPLFYYILKEAELERGGRSLGRVGRGIVVETLVGLLWHDKTSFLRMKPDWTPWAGAVAGQPYTMAHFLSFAYGSGDWKMKYPPRGPWREDVPAMPPDVQQMAAQQLG